MILIVNYYQKFLLKLKTNCGQRNRLRWSVSNFGELTVKPVMSLVIGIDWSAFVSPKTKDFAGR